MQDTKEVPTETVSATNGSDVENFRDDSSVSDDGKTPAPMMMKIIAIIAISVVGFGGHWSSGVTGALKSTLKKEMHINNTQYAIFGSAEAFIKLVIIPLTGPINDRFGGASNMVWGNLIFTIGAILVAAATQVRSYNFMIAGIVIQSIGDAATQVSQYKLFSSWFPPSYGFAATLGFELGLGKIGTFVGKSTANVIAENLGNFSWAYWMAVFMNIFTNVANLFYWWFCKWCEKRYVTVRDPATGETLRDTSKRFKFDKMLRLPWTFWLLMLLTTFQTTTSTIFAQNGTELAQQRFDISAVKAGWYSSLSQFLGFFFVPAIGFFMDFYGQRVTLMLTCTVGYLISMCLSAFGPNIAGTAASFAVFAVANSLGPCPLIDAIRTSMSNHSVFATGYTVKVTINNCMTIIVLLLAGVIQDRDNDSYANVTKLYVALAGFSVLVALIMQVFTYTSTSMAILQWTRKKRSENGEVIKAKAEEFAKSASLRRFNMINFAGIVLLMLGSCAAFFWGLATGNQYSSSSSS